MAANESSGPPTSIAIAIKQDTFFGFHGLTQVAVGLTDMIDFTVYGILWTIPAFGVGGGGDLWTEWGVGAALNLLDGNLSVNPQIGLLSGGLLSGSSFITDGARGLFGEGIVPNITITYGDGLIEGQVYAGFYIALREFRNSNQNEYIHYWANAGILPVSWLSVGVHWEHLVQIFGAGDVEDLYQWIGPYIEAKASAGFIRFSGGADVAPDNVADFYQLTTGLSF